jgi:hypothetical protein
MGFHRFAVVLVDRFDCRSRRAARGTVRPRAKSPRKRRRLVLPHCSEGRKSVRKPDSGGKARGTVAGPRSRWLRKRPSSGHSSMEGASSRQSRLFLTRRRGKRFWRPIKQYATLRRDRERQRQVLPPRSRLTRPRRRGAGRRGPSIERPRRNARRPHPPSDDEGSVVDACRS